MSNVIDTKVPDSRSHVENQPPRPAIRKVLQQIGATVRNDETVVFTERSIELENAGQRTTISFAPVDVDTVDGFRITDIIYIRTPLTAFKYFDETKYSYLNAFATTGAIVRDSNGEDAIVSRLPVFEGNDEALPAIYGPLIPDVARLQVIGPHSAFYNSQGRKAEYNAELLGIPLWDEPSPWGKADFERAREHMEDFGAYANAGPSGLTVEFPWELDAVSAIAGHRTSLLEIRADMPHPAAGNGLFYQLRLPLDLSHEDAKSHAAVLNRIEIESVDTPPFFGAWCTLSGTGTLSFFGFWPNLLNREDIVTNLAIWSWRRSRFARQVIGNM